MNRFGSFISLLLSNTVLFHHLYKYAKPQVTTPCLRQILTGVTLRQVWNSRTSSMVLLKNFCEVDSLGHGPPTRMPDKAKQLK